MGHHEAYRPRREIGVPGDTIAAVATPPGRGGIGIVRVSGPQVTGTAAAVLGALPPPRKARYQVFRDQTGTPIDSGVALYFPAPSSFTGEDVLELQGHGGTAVMDMLLQAVLEAGARLARPGEFSERAFLNGKMDLAQAEAVADLIESTSRQAVRSAHRSLQGEFSRRVLELAKGIATLRAYVEAGLDFPDEEIERLAEDRIDVRLQELLAAVRTTLEQAGQGALLRDGLTAAIVGQPNVGKSTLLNRLVQRDAAIVTEVPGTTRDILREHIHLDGIPLQLLDTAGLRPSADVVEMEGIQRAWVALSSADVVLLVTDDRAGIGPGEEDILARIPAAVPVLLVRNKIDLSGNPADVVQDPARVEVLLSAVTGAGLDLLHEQLKIHAGYQGAPEGLCLARRRHLDALRRARARLEAGQQRVKERSGDELVAEELRHAQVILGEITGEYVSEDLLDQIFSTFCIGK